MISWLETSALAVWVRESPSLWAYPTVLTLHTVGLSIVVGANAVVDLRLLGFGARVPLSSLASLFPLVWWAFAVNALSGFLLFIADASNKSVQTVFYVKLAFIALALWNAAIVRRVVVREGSPRRTRLAMLSLLLWAGAIAAGRLMAYL